MNSFYISIRRRMSLGEPYKSDVIQDRSYSCISLWVVFFIGFTLNCNTFNNVLEECLFVRLSDFIRQVICMNSIFKTILNAVVT